MTSIPQIHADINALQMKLAEANARIAEMENTPQAMREILVPFETVKVEYRERVSEPVTVYVDNPEHIAAIAALQAIIRGRE